MTLRQQRDSPVSYADRGNLFVRFLPVKVKVLRTVAVSSNNICTNYNDYYPIGNS